MTREEAYRIVQAAAAAAWDEGASFRERLAADPEVARRLPPPELDELFDPTRSLRHLDVVFDRLAKLPVREGA